MHSPRTPPGSDHPLCALSLALVPLSRLSRSSPQPKTPTPTPPPGCPPPSKPTPPEPKALIVRLCRISLGQSQPQPPPAGIWTGTIEFINCRYSLHNRSYHPPNNRQNFVQPDVFTYQPRQFPLLICNITYNRINWRS